MCGLFNQNARLWDYLFHKFHNWTVDGYQLTTGHRYRYHFIMPHVGNANLKDPPGCSRRAGGKRPWSVRLPDPAEELTRMCPSGESHVPEGELLGTREQGKRVRRGAGEYPPARLPLPGGRTA